ncbi:MAG: hypothetical protein IJQ72_05410 [Bacilli bacterium]|nr:hypothetical protein [Bacilli bacterium]
MKNINQYNFDIIHVATHLRDTLEYVLPREHEEKVYNQRKEVLTKGLSKETPLGKFLEANKDKFTELLKNYDELLEEVYGENSTILVKTAEGKIRVDHSQHLRIYELVTAMMEPIRDIIYFHVNLARKQNENEPVIEELMPYDDRQYRLFAYLLMMQDFQKSFFEFQKVMGEAGGKPTPQSNFIVQNELSKYAKMLRNIREHTRFTDNETLDVLDKCLQVVEMSEGRRDRRDNKNFPDLFKEALEGVNAKFTLNGPKWQEKFNKALQEMLADIRNNATAKA